MNTAAQSNLLNGVDAGALMATVNAIKDTPSLAEFQFRAKNRVVEGALNRTTVQNFHGAGEEHRTDKTFTLENAEHQVLLGQDQAPNPVEYVLHALLGCMTTTTMYKAAAAGIEIDSISSEVDGDIDLQGLLGLDPSVRPGYQEIRVRMRIKSRGDRSALRELHKSSPVFDTVSQPVPIKVQIEFED